MMNISRGQMHTLLYNRIRVGLTWDVERALQLLSLSSVKVVFSWKKPSTTAR